jgi:hypothetical protein
VKYALGAALPLAVLVAAALKTKHRNPGNKRKKDPEAILGEVNDTGSPTAN